MEEEADDVPGGKPFTRPLVSDCFDSRCTKASQRVRRPKAVLSFVILCADPLAPSGRMSYSQLKHSRTSPAPVELIWHDCHSRRNLGLNAIRHDRYDLFKMAIFASWRICRLTLLRETPASPCIVLARVQFDPTLGERYRSQSSVTM